MPRAIICILPILPILTTRYLSTNFSFLLKVKVNLALFPNGSKIFLCQNELKTVLIIAYYDWGFDEIDPTGLQSIHINIDSVSISQLKILKSKGLPLRNADVEYRSEFRTTLTLFCWVPLRSCVLADLRKGLLKQSADVSSAAAIRRTRSRVESSSNVASVQRTR